MEPIVTEVRASVSIGGKLQLVQYEQWGDYMFSMSRAWSGEWTEAEAKAFHAEKLIELREEVEPHVAAEYDALHDAREELNS